MAKVDPIEKAMQQLKAALEQSASVDLSWIQPPPTAHDWTLAPDALRMVTQIVNVVRPRHILELGSGLSTRVLARTAASLKPACVISSVDHDPQYNYGASEAAQKKEAADGAAPSADAADAPPVPMAKVKFHLAPLVVREFGGKLVGVYLMDPKKLASKRPVDLVVIDGPPINLGGREGTLYQVMDYVRPGTIILLDDSKRPEERAAIQAWQDNFGDAIHAEQLPGFAKGMAAIIIRKPVPMAQFWRYRFDLTKSQIEALVPEGQGVMMAGEAWWGQEVGLARPVMPFMEKDGQYWGEPIDDAAAIAELEKNLARGVRFIAFGWQVKWWFNHYSGLMNELTRRGRKVLDNDRVTMFEVLSPKS